MNDRHGSPDLSQPVSELPLHQELLLLGLRDDLGTPRTATHTYAVAGGILAELVLEERLALEERRFRGPLVLLQSRTQIGDPVLDDVLRQIELARKPAAATSWIERWAKPAVTHRVARQLTRRGTLREEKRRVFFFFSQTVFPQVDPGPEQRIAARIRGAVEGDEMVDPRTAAVVTIAGGAGLLKPILGRRALRGRKARLAALADGSAVADEAAVAGDVAWVARLSARASRAAAAAAT